jgi:hypothetical protein
MLKDHVLIEHFEDFWMSDFLFAYILPTSIACWNFKKGYTGESLTVRIGEGLASVECLASTGHLNDIPKQEFYNVYEVVFLYQSFSPLHSDIAKASPFSEYIISILHNCPPPLITQPYF